MGRSILTYQRSKNLVKYILIVFLIFFAVRPIDIFNINFTGIFSFFILFLTIFVAYFYRIRIERNFIIASVILLLINSVAVFKYQEFYPRFFLIYWFNLFYAYVTIKFLKKEFFIVLENTLYYWTLWIIMPLYLISLVAPGMLEAFLMKLPFSTNQGLVYSNRTYSILFTYGADIPFRNCGFAWEPGMFASALSMGILANLINNQFKLNFRFFFMIIAIFSTFSTTGYIMIAIFLIWIFVNRYIKKSYSILILPLLIGGLVFIFTSPVITQKLNYSIAEAENTDALVRGAHQAKETAVHPQRIASLLISLRDFKENPVFGTLGNFEDRWFHKKFGKMSNLNVVSGIGNFLTIYGLIGFVIVIFFLWRSIRLIDFEYGLKNGYFVYIIILGISFSYYIFKDALFYCFIFYAVFRTNYSFKTIQKLISPKTQIK